MDWCVCVLCSLFVSSVQRITSGWNCNVDNSRIVLHCISLLCILLRIWFISICRNLQIGSIKDWINKKKTDFYRKWSRKTETKISNMIQTDFDWRYFYLKCADLGVQNLDMNQQKKNFHYPIYIEWTTHKYTYECIEGQPHFWNVQRNDYPVWMNKWVKEIAREKHTINDHVNMHAQCACTLQRYGFTQ